MYLLSTGWKVPSLIDVYNKTTFTLWLCGCNLKCPFCHNWKLAESIGCKRIEIDDILRELEDNLFLVDYLHITGGEPLLQWKNLALLLEEVRELDGKVSLNTNFTLYSPLKYMLDNDLVDHLATDLKIPPSKLYGVANWKQLWEQYLKSLELLRDYSIILELRIPIARGFSKEEMSKYLEEALRRLEGVNFYVILNPLLGYPIVNPRDKEWCKGHCSPKEEDINFLKEELEERGIKNIYVNRFV